MCGGGGGGGGVDPQLTRHRLFAIAALAVFIKCSCFPQRINDNDNIINRPILDVLIPQWFVIS